MTRRLAVILWPAFLVAAVLEMIVFAVVDPAQLHGVGGAPIEFSATTVYSVAFFVFWVVVSGACAMTAWLADTSLE
jgi:hypothetical protein